MNMGAGKIRANDKRTRMKARSLLLLAGWLAGAAVIIGFEMDRESRYRPALARYVPPLFRSFSQAILVAQLLDSRKDADGTFAEAGKLVLRRPMAAENLSLYALAAARAGKERQSLQAISLAAARGWHDEVAQYAALDGAVQTGDWPSASLRLQALLQVRSRPAILIRAVQDFTTSAGGRTALAALIARNPPFQYQILGLAGTYGTADAFPLLVSALKPVTSRMDCGSLRLLVSRWLAHGDAGLAIDAWTGLCSKGEPGGETDLAFPSRDGDANPFAWHMSDQPSLSWSVEPASGRLSYRNDDDFGRLLAWRMLILRPGIYRLKMEGRPAVKSGNSPSLHLKCVPSGRAVEMEWSVNDPGVLAIMIPQGCNVQKLEVKILRGSFLDLRLTYL